MKLVETGLFPQKNVPKSCLCKELKVLNMQAQQISSEKRDSK